MNVCLKYTLTPPVSVPVSASPRQPAGLLDMMGWQLSASRQTWLRPEGEERLYDDKTSDLSGAVEPALAWLGDGVRHFTGHCLLSLELSVSQHCSRAASNVSADTTEK